MAHNCDICKDKRDICEAGKYYRDQIMSFLKTGWGAAILLTGLLLTINPDLINYHDDGRSKRNALVLVVGILAANILWAYILGLMYKKATQHNHSTIPTLWKILVPFVILFLYGILVVLIYTNIVFTIK